MSKIIVKLYFENEIRRIKVTTKTTYKEFIQTLYEILKIKDETLTIEKFNKISFKYTDVEGEEVTFSSNEEWIDVLESFNGDILKITVVSNETKNEKKSETKSEQKEFDLSQLFSTFQPFISQFTNNNNGFDFSQIFGGNQQQENGFDFNNILQMFMNKEQKGEFNFEEILKKFSCHKRDFQEKESCHKREKKKIVKKKNIARKEEKIVNHGKVNVIIGENLEVIMVMVIVMVMKKYIIMLLVMVVINLL